MREGAAQRRLAPVLSQHYGDGVVIRQTRQIATSTQARVFITDVRDSPQPIVAKLFRQKRSGVVAALNDEYESLSVMASVFSNVEIYGWCVTSPVPLSRSFTPPAILMTAVPGAPLDNVLPRLTQIDRHALATTVAEALNVYWTSAERIIADVTLANILADPARMQLSFVDPGLPDPAFSCPDISDTFAPGSRDLAFLLVHVLATNVRISMLTPRRAQIRASFATDVVRQFAAKHLRDYEMAAFLSELTGCAAKHVARIPTGGPLEPWRRLIRNRVNQGISTALNGLAEH